MTNYNSGTGIYFNNAGSSTIPAGNYYFQNMNVGGNAVITIQGPANIVVDDLRFDSNVDIEIDATNGPVNIFFYPHAEADGKRFDEIKTCYLFYNNQTPRKEKMMKKIQLLTIFAFVLSLSVFQVPNVMAMSGKPDTSAMKEHGGSEKEHGGEAVKKGKEHAGKEHGGK